LLFFCIALFLPPFFCGLLRAFLHLVDEVAHEGLNDAEDHT